jgi:rhodanese-related sulfurtransferase
MGHAADDTWVGLADNRLMTLTLAEMIASARVDVREIRAPQAADALHSREVDLVVDVREPDEFRGGHLPGAVNVPRGMLEIRADPASPACDPVLSADQAARILVYCTKGPGARSLLAAQTLASMGYDHVDVLAGGLAGWAEAGLPLEQLST